APGEASFRFRARQAGNPTPAAEPLERTCLAVPHRAFLSQPDMADLPPEIAGSFVQPSAKDEPRAHPRPEGEKDHVARPYPCPEPPLGKGTCVCVVLQERPASQGLLQLFHDRHMVPSGKVGGDRRTPLPLSSGPP